MNNCPSNFGGQNLCLTTIQTSKAKGRESNPYELVRLQPSITRKEESYADVVHTKLRPCVAECWNSEVFLIVFICVYTLLLQCMSCFIFLKSFTKIIIYLYNFFLPSRRGHKLGHITWYIQNLIPPYFNFYDNCLSFKICKTAHYISTICVL